MQRRRSLRAMIDGAIYIGDGDGNLDGKSERAVLLLGGRGRATCIRESWGLGSAAILDAPKRPAISRWLRCVARASAPFSPPSDAQTLAEPRL